MADKLCMEAFANHLIDHFRLCHKGWTVFSGTLTLLTEHRPIDGGMKDFALEEAAYHLRLYGFGGFRENWPMFCKNFLDLSAENSQALMEKLMTKPAGRPAWETNGCHWHRHLLAPTCEGFQDSGAEQSVGNKRPRTE